MPRVSLGMKVSALAVGLTFSGTLVMGAVGLSTLRQETRTAAGRRMDLAVATRRADLSAALSRVRGDLANLATGADAAGFLTATNAEASEAAFARLIAVVSQSATAGNYANVLLLDAAGRIVFGLRESPAEGLPAGLGRIYARMGAAMHQVTFFEDFASYPIADGPQAFVGRPVWASTDRRGRPAGYLVVRFGHEVLAQSKLFDESLGDGAQVLAVGSDGLLRSPARFPPLPSGVPATKAGLKRTVDGLFRAANGKVFKAVRADVMGSEWTLLAEAECRTGFAPSWWASALVGCMAAILLAAGLLAAAVSRMMAKPVASLTDALWAISRRERVDVVPGQGRTDEVGDIARAVEAIRNAAAADMARVVSLGEENERHANVDALTGLPNRRCFFARLASMDEEGTKVSWIGLVDLNRFKPVNDVYGHAVGDEVLREIASRLARGFGKGNLLARLGGDEFAFVLSEDLEVAEALAFCDRVVETVEAPVSVGTLTLRLSAAVGIAAAVPGRPHSEQVERADFALYHSKDVRSTRTVAFDVGHETRIRRRHKVEGAIAWAILDAELRVDLQPVVDARTGRIVGFEALGRWWSPDLGDVPPGEFIAAAERASIMHRVTPVLLSKTLQAADNLPEDVCVAFNLSTQDILSPVTMGRVREMVAKSRISPSRLSFEVTETALMGAYDEASEALSSLRDLGFKIAIDDFGTGYSSLSHVHRLPLDRIKIDRSFVPDVVRDRRSRDLVRAIVDLSRNLGVECVVEGVETEDERRVLTGLGCVLMQGYLFGRPMSVAKAVALAAPEPIGLAS